VGWTRRRFLELGAIGAGAAALAACSMKRGGDSGDAAGAEVVRYGKARRQRLELTRPDGATAPVPVVVVLHGGFWMSSYDLRLMRPLVPSLVAQGWAVVNVEYRSVGDDGGGWPGTFDDVAAAVDSLASPGVTGLDLGRLVTLGHSAGGHLAVWAAARHRLPPDAPGADPAVRPIGAVAQAGLLDLVQAEADRLGGGAASSLLGGFPDAVPDRYALASPIARVPLGVPVELVHGPYDGVVPLDQSERYQAAAVAAGDQATLHQVPGDHFALIDPASEAWATTLRSTATLLGG
jgi:acetyl esterase/lipase